jgi:hypothetical protein
MTKARPVWVLREEIGGKVLYIIKKTSQDGLPPEAITGENGRYIATVRANANKDGQSQPNILNWEVVRSSSDGC